MASIGSGLRQLGAAIQSQEVAAREQERIELARQREERLAEQQRMETERIVNAREALKKATSAEDQTRLLFDMWRNVTIEINTLTAEVSRLRGEIDTLKGASYNQWQFTKPPTSGVIGSEYFNQF